MMKLKLDHTSKFIFWLVFATISLGFAFLYISDPYTGDDVLFIKHLKFRLSSGDTHSFSEWMNALWQLFENNYELDVSRIGNFLAIAMLLLPGWIASSISAICFVWAFRMMCRFADVRPGDCVGLALLSVLVLFGVPWWDNMYSIMYSFNYTCSTALMLWGIRLFTRPKAIKLPAAILAGLLIGGWHECFSCALLGGAILTFIFNKSMIRRDRIVFVVSIFVGSLFIFTAPSMHCRSEKIIEVAHKVILLYAFTYYLLLIAVGACLLKQEWRPLARRPIVLFGIASGGLILLLFNCTIIRAIFPCTILSSVALVYLLENMFSMAFAKPRTWLKICTSAVMLMILAHIAAVCVYAVDYRHSIQEIHGLAQKDFELENRRQIFATVNTGDSLSPLLMYKLNRMAYKPQYATIRWLAFIVLDDFGVNVIPKELKNYHAGMGSEVESNLEVRNFKGRLVSPTAMPYYFTDINIHYGNIEEHSQAQTVPFISDDGYIYTYIMPIRSFKSYFMGQPTQIYFNGRAFN